jgi:hypothetical protein
MTENKHTTQWVVFIDALSPNDLSRTEFLDETMAGTMEANVPRVTPHILSQVYTGKTPEYTGMGAMHSFGDEDHPHRPRCETIIEEVDNSRDVLNLYMPYCGPPDLDQGSASLSTSPNGQEIFPQNMTSQLTVPGPSGDLMQDRHHATVFDHSVDYVTQLFSTARTLSPQFDVIFLGIRLIDSYCHFQYRCGEDGRGADVGSRYRDKLAEAVDIQLSQIDASGDDVFWFSDHGATELTDTFYVNKWLKDNGYLEYEIDMEFESKLRSEGLTGEDHPSNQRIQNQLSFNHPAVTVDWEQSNAVCDDPYDGTITLLNGADDETAQAIMDDLSTVDEIRDVHHRDDLYGDEADFTDDIPEILPDRAEGVFASGNIHPNPIGMGYYRSGVHDKWGCYGGNVDSGSGTASPTDIYRKLNDYIDYE